MRSLPSDVCTLATSALVAATGLVGCALEPGQPWGELELAVAVSTEIPDARLDAEGRIRTANDFRIVLDSFAGTVDSVSVVTGGDDATVSFDPAEPPPGYSLCHAGHCHADSGALVPYEEIEAELGGGTGAENVAFAYGETYSLGNNTTLALPDVCPAAGGELCALPRGRVEAIVLTLRDVRVAGTAFDSRTGESARIDPAGVPFDLVVAGPFELRAPLAARIDRGATYAVRRTALAELGADTFDAMTWSDDALQVQQELAEGLSTSLRLSLLPNP